MTDEELARIERDVTGDGLNLHHDATVLLAEVKRLRDDCARWEARIRTLDAAVWVLLGMEKSATREA